jgi:hypothetical protein
VTCHRFSTARESASSVHETRDLLLKADPEGPTLIFYAALQHGFHFIFCSFRASAAHILSPHFSVRSSSSNFLVRTGIDCIQVIAFVVCLK